MTRRGARVLAKFQRGAIGRVSNIEAQEPSPIIDEAQEAASADLGARFVTTTQKENSPMIRAAQEAASTDVQRGTCRNHARNTRGARGLLLLGSLQCAI